MRGIFAASICFNACLVRVGKVRRLGVGIRDATVMQACCHRARWYKSFWIYGCEWLPGRDARCDGATADLAAVYGGVYDRLHRYTWNGEDLGRDCESKRLAQESDLLLVICHGCTTARLMYGGCDINPANVLFGMRLHRQVSGASPSARGLYTKRRYEILKGARRVPCV